MGQAGEPVLVEALIPQPSVKAFDVGVLVGLARFDQAQRYAALVRPGQQGLAREFLAVVGANDLGQSTLPR